MLNITLHAGPIKTASQFNQVGWMHIGYDRLEPLADYKAVLFAHDTGPLPLAYMTQYPRFSGSNWDLVARMALISLTKQEALPRPSNEPAPFAFANAISGFIEHIPGGRLENKSRLGTVEIKQVGSKRGLYKAHFEEDLFDKRDSPEFTHRPKALVHWDLLARAVAWTLSGEEKLPERPPLALPQDHLVDGKKMVDIDTLIQPARGCFERWLQWTGNNMIERAEKPCRLAAEEHFTQFLGKTV